MDSNFLLYAQSPTQCVVSSLSVCLSLSRSCFLLQHDGFSLCVCSGCFVQALLNAGWLSCRPATSSFLPRTPAWTSLLRPGAACGRGMGKNAAHKSMQRARHVGGAEDGAVDPGAGDGTVDASFHTPEWHAARIAALTTERMSWEDWKKKQKDDAAAEAAAGATEERAMREYRAQLDADRAAKLAKGTNHAHLREPVRP